MNKENREHLQKLYTLETGKNPFTNNRAVYTKHYTMWVEDWVNRFRTYQQVTDQQDENLVLFVQDHTFTVEEIKKAVFDEFWNTGIFDLHIFPNDYEMQYRTAYGRFRHRPYPNIRQCAMYFIKQKFPNISLKSIGTKFTTGRDHSTVIHGVQTYIDDVETDIEAYKRHLRLCDKFGVVNRIESKLRNVEKLIESLA